MSEQRTTQTPLQVTWADIEEACDRLAPVALSRGISAILPVLRGGLVPATILSYRTGIPIPMAIHPTTNYIRNPRSDILILDEVSGSGETMRAMREFYPNAWRVALYVKPNRGDACHWWIHEVPQDRWLEFPLGRMKTNACARPRVVILFNQQGDGARGWR